VLYWFYRLCGHYEFVKGKMRPDEVLIFDEGFMHRVVQLFASSVEVPDRHQISKYISRVPRPDLVIFIQAPKDMCEQRIYQRGLWERMRDKEPDEISRFVNNAYLAVNLAIEEGRRLDWSIIQIDNDHQDLRSAQKSIQNQFRIKLETVKTPVSIETL
jgi:thymidylate kinase